MSTAFWNSHLIELERALEDRKRDLEEAHVTGNETLASRLASEVSALETKLDGARRLTRDIQARRGRPDALLNIPFGVALGVGAYLFHWAFFWGLGASAALIAAWYFVTGRSARRDGALLFNRHLVGIVWMIGAFAMAFFLKRG